MFWVVDLVLDLFGGLLVVSVGFGSCVFGAGSGLVFVLCLLTVVCWFFVWVSV